MSKIAAIKNMKKGNKKNSVNRIDSRLLKANNEVFNKEEINVLYKITSLFSKDMKDFFILKKEEPDFYMIGCAILTKKGIVKCLLSKYNNEISDYLHYIPYKSIHSIRFSLNSKIENDKQVNEFMITFSRGGSNEDNVYFKCESNEESLKFIKSINDSI